MNANKQLIVDLIRDVPDFPKPGVVFKDITPMLASPTGLRAAIEELAATAPVALELGAGFVPVRKPGKLPGDVYSQSFSLEYGHETLTIHTDSILPGARVLVIDDVLATGGTVGATASLIKRLGANLVHVSVLMELSFLNGRSVLTEHGITNYSAVVTV